MLNRNLDYLTSNLKSQSTKIDASTEDIKKTIAST